MLVRIPPILQPRDGHAPALQADQFAAWIGKCCKLARRAHAPARLPRLRRRSMLKLRAANILQRNVREMQQLLCALQLLIHRTLYVHIALNQHFF